MLSANGVKSAGITRAGFQSVTSFPTLTAPPNFSYTFPTPLLHLIFAPRNHPRKRPVLTLEITLENGVFQTSSRLPPRIPIFYGSAKPTSTSHPYFLWLCDIPPAAGSKTTKTGARNTPGSPQKVCSLRCPLCAQRKRSGPSSHPPKSSEVPKFRRSVHVGQDHQRCLWWDRCLDAEALGAMRE